MDEVRDDFEDGMVKRYDDQHLLHPKKDMNTFAELSLTATESTLSMNGNNDSYVKREHISAQKNASKKVGMTKSLTNILFGGCMCHPEGMVGSIFSKKEQSIALKEQPVEEDPQGGESNSGRIKYSNRSKNVSLSKRQERLQHMIVNHSISKSKKKYVTSGINGGKGVSSEKFKNVHSFDDAAYILHKRQQSTKRNNYPSSMVRGDEEYRQQPFTCENGEAVEVCMMGPVSTMYDCYDGNPLPQRKRDRFPTTTINAIQANMCGGLSSTATFHNHTYTSENNNIQGVVSVLSNGADTANNSELMYDSDPGDLRKSRNRINKGKTLIPNHSQAVRLANCDSQIFDGKSVVTAGKSIADSITTLSLLQNGKTDFSEFDPTHVVKHVGEFMNKRMTFNWHISEECQLQNTVKDHNQKAKQPFRSFTKRVQVWVELGSVLRNQVIHPKLCWSAVEATPKWSRFIPGNSKMKQTNKSNSSIEETKREAQHLSLQSIDLLDVCSILDVGDLDRSQYPFAIRKRTFVIATSDQKVYFEASSEKEKTQTIFSLKLLVSHFAAGIVARNDDVFTQYFNPSDAEVPGEVPFALEAAHHEC